MFPHLLYFMKRKTKFLNPIYYRTISPQNILLDTDYLIQQNNIFVSQQDGLGTSFFSYFKL